jgi:hypothetical protein
MTSIDRKLRTSLRIGSTTRARSGAGRWGLAIVVVLAGCARGPRVGDEASAEGVVTFRQDLTASTQKLVVNLPSSSTVANVVLGAAGSLAVGDRATTKRADGTFAQVTNAGSASSNLGADSQVGDALSIAPLTLQDRAHVNGNATSAAGITRGTGTVVTGQVSQNTPIAYDRLSWDVSFPASGPDVTVAPSGSKTLNPGSSGNVHAFAGATLSLRTGTYYMDSLFMEPQSHLAVNTTAGPVFVYLRQGFTFRGNTVFTGPTDRLLIGYVGTAAPAFDTSFDGTFVAPNAAVTLGVGSTSYAGAVYAQSISVFPDVKVTQRVFSGWGQIAFDVVPTLSCVERRTDGSRAALLGYLNPNPQPVTVPIGTRNGVTPSPQDHGQPTAFLPGRFPAAFSVDFGTATSLTWQLDGASLAIPSTAAACPATQTAALVQDTTVAASAPKQSFGAGTTLTIGDDSHALVQFDRDAIKKAVGAGRYVTKAMLTLTQTSGDHPAVDALVLTRRWTEAGATWDCATDTDASATGESCAPGTTWTMKRDDSLSRNPWHVRASDRRVIGSWSGGKVTFDVTRDVGNLLGTEGLRHPPAWALVKQPGAAGTALLASRESSTPPQLVLTIATRPQVDPAGSQPLSYRVDTAIVPSPSTVDALPDGAVRTVSALVDPSGQQVHFVDRELVFSIHSDAELAPVLARWNGTVVQEIAPPGGLPLPITAVVRIDNTRAQRDSLRARSLEVDNRPRGAHRLSSTTGLDTLAAGAEEVLAGRSVSLNWLAADDAIRTEDWAHRNVSEGPFTGAGPTYSSNPFFFPGFASCEPDRGSNESPPPCLNTFNDGTPMFQFLNIGEAWRALALSGRMTPGVVPVGIVDGGFAGFHDDYPSNLSANTVLFGMTAKGDSLGHGTRCVLAGFGQVGNKIGAAGPGAPVAAVQIFPTPESLISDIASLVLASASRNRITSISRNARIPAGADLLGYPTASFATSAIREAGTLIFASAGNINEDVDAEDCFITCWERAHIEPCEDDGVDCVSGLAFNDNVKDPSSSWGSETRTIAGLFNVANSSEPLAVAPDQIVQTTAFTAAFGRNFTGTSAATPFIAGIASLVSAADPSRSIDNVEACLYASTRQPGDGFFTAYPDALRALQCMIGNGQRGFPAVLKVIEPVDGQRAHVGDLTQFEATATDYEVGNGLLAIGWSSDIDGALGSTFSDLPRPLTFRTAGTHRVTATTFGSGGETLTATVTVVVDNPVSELLITTPPTDGFHTPAGINTTIVGRVALPGFALQPCDSMVWSATAPDGTSDFSGLTGCFIQPAFATPGLHVVTLNFTDSLGRASPPATREINVDLATAPIVRIVTPVDTTGTEISVLYDETHPIPVKAQSNIANVSYAWSVIVGDGTIIPVAGAGDTINFQPTAVCGDEIELLVVATDQDTGLGVVADVTFFAESTNGRCIK